MMVRKVFRWMLVLLLLMGAAGVWGLHWTWRHTDQLLLEGIRSEVTGRVPDDWEVGIESAHLEHGGLVRLQDIQIRPRGESQAVVEIPECLLLVDVSLLLEHQQVSIRHVTVNEPTLTLTRHRDGRWNWQALGPPCPSDQTPAIDIRGGTVIVRTEAADDLPASELASRDVDVQLTPSGQRRYLINGVSHVDGAGALSFQGEVDLTTRVWELSGRAEQIRTSDGLFENAAVLAPDMHRQFAQLSHPAPIVPSAEDEPAGPTAAAIVQPAIHRQSESATTSHLRLPDLGISASIGVAFQLNSDGQQSIPDFRVCATIYDGLITEPLSPVPLEGLTGQLLIENDRLVISEVRASNGDSELHLNGEIWHQSASTIHSFEVVATNLFLDREIRPVLPPGGQKLFDLLDPSGLFTIKARFHSDGIHPPQIQLDEFAALNCQITHAYFRQPVKGVAGTIKQQGDTLTLNLTGRAADRQVLVTGWVKNPGPEAEQLIDIVVDQYPVDKRFPDALADPRHAGVRQGLRSLQLTGRADIRARFTRPPGPNQKVDMALVADVTQGSLNFERFPYAISNLSGRVVYDPRVENVWRFRELQGQHGSSPIQGEGLFRVDQQPGQLELLLSAGSVPLDRDLYEATVTANPDMQDVWETLNPSGLLQLNDIHVVWFPGSRPVVKLPAIHVEGGRIQLRPFPFVWERIRADLRWNGSRATIREAEGWHNETFARIEGQLTGDAAFFDTRPEGSSQWHLRLPEITVTNLDPGGELRQALPVDIGAVLNELDPRGPLDLKHLGLEIKAYPARNTEPERMTAHCSWRTELARDRLGVGVDLSNVSGVVDTSLKWDGAQVVGSGRIDFARADALGMAFTNVRGPFRIEGNRVSVGTLQLPDGSDSLAQVPATQQLTATAYGGLVAVNAEAKLRPETPQQSTYRARVAFANASLAEWARQMGQEALNLSGTMAGELNLYGMGSSPRQLRGDDCWVQISDAQLGELPVFAQVFAQLIDPRKRDNTAFKYAYLECSIHDGLFDFGATPASRARDTRRIQLVGDVLSMLGQGYVPFAPDLDQPMELDLYSKADQRFPLLRLPVINQIGRAVSDNWVYVKVTGTPNQPQISTRAQVPILNDVLRGFYQAMEAGLPLPQPRPIP